MVTRKDVFPSKYLKADDLNGDAIVATIKSAALETMKGFDGKERQQVVLYFSRTLKPLPLYMTNYDSVADILGEETEDWGGGRIELYPTTTVMSGVTKPCVRIRKPPEASAKKAAKAPKAAPAAAKPDFDDEIAF
jgi:hypothetical protein